VIKWRRGEVTAVRRQWKGAIELEVAISGIPVRALAYPELTGAPVPGDQVLLNTGALDLGLGTGGYALVVAIPDRLPPDPQGPGHLVKARYTPLQATVLGADEQGSVHHRTLAEADSLDGIGVVIADLHSALPAVLAAFYSESFAAGRRVAPHPGQRSSAPTTTHEAGHPRQTGTTGLARPAGPTGDVGDSGVTAPARLTDDVGTTGLTKPAGLTGDAGANGRPKVAYVMLDGGALPAWFSRTVSMLADCGWLAGTITVGQAFGGDLEAVTLHSGLLAARHVVGAELIVVAQGPGNLGTGTRWGFSGVASGEAVNAAAVLGGRPVASLRISEADPRPRHRGISHHSLTAYGRVALARADVVVPDLPGEFGAEVAEAAKPLADRHNLVTVSVDGLREVLADCPVPLSTMGRNLDQDLAYFLAAAAAGRYAATLAPVPDRP
jgi:hypothetical protein